MKSQMEMIKIGEREVWYPADEPTFKKIIKKKKKVYEPDIDEDYEPIDDYEIEGRCIL